MPDPAPLPVYLINAFAPTPAYSGNQAAVVIFPSDTHPKTQDEAFMLSYAKDFGFSETAYLVPMPGNGEGGVGKYGLRWWTPGVEAALCGHATLASSQAVFSTNPDITSIEFFTRYSGVLTAKRIEDSIVITLPTLSKDTYAAFGSESAKDPKKLEEAADVFGLKTGNVESVETYSFGDRTSPIVQLSPETDITRIDVVWDKLLAFSSGLIIVTQLATDQPDDRLHINTRVFAPGLAILEDPVCGSAHAYLSGYYLASPRTSELLPQKFLEDPSKVLIGGNQPSPRGGRMTCALGEGNARLIGKCREFGRGTLSGV
ncbi:hypothetical protein L198_01054 [Cryptococcus wingfieldii CBS 7118]|uniref:Phenazine biosynthesis protein n=1 Tax=Cryptococcus wingfieldii CBS 7118 TaxID=1295528 RepID=A0A1E3K353_9TREE|nr:hypothetical protein L198_01054 [Cryptococcus wingfieldii CBS 7118]ODO07475.1 hypothetical protein L198_01054 [Cryptococcus wingfieldii CBS 7118]